MKRRSAFSVIFLALAAAASPLSPGEMSAMAAERPRAYFIDILYLNEGKTPADAKAYFDKVEPVVAKHGLKRITPRFAITQKMAGEIEPNLIGVWSVSNPQATFEHIFADPNYLEHAPLRNATFDMSRSHMFMMKAAE
jgi:uncharacterized protein (DUF1330 family)